jgi:integrase
MPLKLFKRRTLAGKDIWHYRGTLDGDRLRGTTGTTNRKTAEKFIAKIERRHSEGLYDGEKRALTFPQAVALYLKAGKSDKYLGKIEDHWKNTRVSKMKPGAIRQSAIDIYPDAGWATRNRQVITPTQAVINHCADLELCPPIRIKRFKHEKKIKQPVTIEWLDTFCAHASPLNAALATFMFATGCRISEARRLDWPDIDFQQRTILVVKTKAKRQRLPHMPARLLVALANLPRDDKPFGCWSESSLRRMWDEDVARTAKAAPGFVRLTFHSCRHGMATKLLRDGVDPVTAAGLAGMSVQVFLSTYAHAMQKPQLTEQLFDTQLTRDDLLPEQKQQVTEK